VWVSQGSGLVLGRRVPQAEGPQASPRTGTRSTLGSCWEGRHGRPIGNPTGQHGLTAAPPGKSSALPAAGRGATECPRD